MAQVLPFKPQSAAFAEPAAPRARRFLGDILVGSGKVAQGALDLALDQQRGQDAPIGRILHVCGQITQETLTEALGEQSGLGRAHLDEEPPQPEVTQRVDPYLCLRIEAIPWRRRAGRLEIAIANPATGAEAAEAFGAPDEPVVFALATADEIRRAIGRRFGSQLVADAERRCGEEFSCRGLVGPGLSPLKLGTVGGVAAAVAFAPLLMLQAALLWALVANLMTTGLRIVALATRFRHGARATRAEATRLSDHRRRPSVSILVPLKGEAAVAGQLIAALGRMEYPAPLLDIKLVLEADDRATAAAVDAAGLPPTVEVVVVPAGTIQTKPRAMNYALPFCRGEIIGVYDAEDLPDPGQIHDVVHRFMEAPAKVACLQGYLDFYNADQNWLSRCFALEYAAWFRVLLAGVQRLGMPIPLGGTTVFFRRAALERVGAWDAHNVTEDADLGMRLARFGYVTEMIATETMEEANAVGPRAWMRQRSRWLKGYAITWATHMRRPGRLRRDLGWRGFLGFQLIFLGGLTSYLAMPLLLALWLGTAGLDLAPLTGGAPGWVLWTFAASMAAGTATMLAIAAVAAIDSGRAWLLPWALTLPLYWPLGAVAAWRAIAEVFYAPFLWHKTEHGAALWRAQPDAPWELQGQTP